LTDSKFRVLRNRANKVSVFSSCGAISNYADTSRFIRSSRIWITSENSVLVDSLSSTNVVRDIEIGEYLHLTDGDDINGFVCNVFISDLTSFGGNMHPSMLASALTGGVTYDPDAGEAWSENPTVGGGLYFLKDDYSPVLTDDEVRTRVIRFSMSRVSVLRQKKDVKKELKLLSRPMSTYTIPGWAYHSEIDGYNQLPLCLASACLLYGTVTCVITPGMPNANSCTTTMTVTNKSTAAIVSRIYIPITVKHNCV